MFYSNPYEDVETETIISDICGAVLSNDHFILKSGLHAEDYVRKDLVYYDPEATFEIARRMAEKALEQFESCFFDIDVVIGPAVGGAILTVFVGFHLSTMIGRKINTAFADKTDTGFEIKRGFEEPIKRKDILLVEDIVTTGGSILSVANEALRLDTTIIGAIAMWNRGTEITSEIVVGKTTIPFVSLCDKKFPVYAANDCPFCKEGRPINTKLGHGAKFIQKQQEQNK
ncbi:MAG: phosphoribosyltransferase family protein [Candidatus Shapirobacteria bacterium]|nr:phosphoribosyltransferase family protein [Candidatus Shapirobacteria bacterium]